MVEIREVKTKKELKTFVSFANELYENYPAYVPILIGDELDMFNPKKNGAYEWSDVRCFLAIQNDRVVGRVGLIHNRKYIEKTGKHQLRITRFDFIDDLEVSKALIDVAIQWAKELGCNELIGPIGFSDMDKEGMLIEGFDELSMYINIYNDAYYIRHMEAMGFEKECDWVEYKITIPEKIDPRIERIAERSIQKFGYKIVKFKHVRDAYPEIYKGLDIMNEVYAKLYGYTQLSVRQQKEFLNNFKWILNREYLFAIHTAEDELIGYGFYAPSLSHIMKEKAKGHLTISAALALLKNKTTDENDTVDLYSIGVRPEYMSKGVNAIILNEGIKACIKNHVKYAETGPCLETNKEIRAQWALFENRQHKRRRCWILHLEDKKAE